MFNNNIPEGSPLSIVGIRQDTHGGVHLAPF